MTKSTQVIAATYASQLIDQATGFSNRIKSVLSAGIPANPAAGVPAVPVGDLEAALGSDNVTKLQAAVSALS